MPQDVVYVLRLEADDLPYSFTYRVAQFSLSLIRPDEVVYRDVLSPPVSAR